MRGYWTMLLTLAAVWGASYLFIKLAVEDVKPAPAMAFRVVVAGALLLGYVLLQRGRKAFSEMRAAWKPCLVLGATNAAIPFWLVGWGETRIDSSVAAIAQASVPIFNLLIALRLLPHEKVSGTRLAGIGLGLVGVALITGIHPEGGSAAVLGTLAVVLSSVSYAFAGVYGQLRVRGTPGPILATGSMLAASVFLVPVALFQLPTEPIGWQAWFGLLALTLAGTAFAQIVLFRILQLYGSTRLSLVTYLMPGFAVLYGAVLLDEPLTAAALGGLALILLGVGLASGAIRRARRREEAPAAP